MHPNCLPIPHIAQSDPRAKELLRVWAARGRQHISLATEIWEDPAAWGIMLVDLAKLIADAYHKSEDRDPVETLGRIRAGVEAEWSAPTDAPRGDLLGR